MIWNKEVSTKLGLIILTGIFVFCGGILIWAGMRGDLKLSFDTGLLSKLNPGMTTGKSTATAIKKFASVDEFKKYLSEHVDSGNNGGFSFGLKTTMAVDSATRGEAVGIAMPDVAMAPSAGGVSTEAGRVSETNVQVAGIDEPDIVKTDGKEIYLSALGGYYPYYRGGVTPMMEMDTRSIMPPYYQNSDTKLVNAFPPADMKIDGKIEKNGNLLLDGKILIVFSNDNYLYAYDVSDKANPKEKWTAKLGDRESLVGARLMDGKIYLTTQSGADYVNPCPMVPLTVGKTDVSIACTDIYYPANGGSADATYKFMVMDSQTGEVKDKTAFVGSAGQTVFYMSNDAIYLTYPTQVDMVTVAYNFFSENSDLVPAWVIERLNKVRGYDLSPAAKSAELYAVLEKLRNSMDNDTSLKMENEMANRSEKFFLKYRRDIGKTGIVKVSLNNFSATAGEVPGTPLNQFSLDEYDNHLRIAVTIGQNWWGIGNFGSSGKTVSDVYVLNDNMEVAGSVKDLGETEQIYSVRFVEDRGYVVTFRQTDPFFVLDLSSPTNPVLRGELKIPGFSSYLHPLSKHKVIGIGREDGKIKVSIFDASDAAKPVEKSKYTLNEYWSAALDNHHAFLLDTKHEVFFIPGSQGGYVFNYAGDDLKLLSAVSGGGVERALYLDDYMYLVGTEKITVLDEKNWEKIKEFDLK